MKTPQMILLALATSALVSGCFTIYESDFPKVEFSRASTEQNACVQLSGFEATETTYLPIYGYETVWRPYRGRRRGYYGMSAEMYSTTTYIPQTKQTTAFVDRARVRLEDAGFLVGVTNAAYRIDVRFAGPMVSGGDQTTRVLLWIGSLLTTDFKAQTWTAALRVYDVKTGRVVMRADYDERNVVTVFGLIPIFGPAGAEATSDRLFQDRCLSALTDRAIADATAFITAQTTKEKTK